MNPNKRKNTNQEKQTQNTQAGSVTEKRSTEEQSKKRKGNNASTEQENRPEKKGEKEANEKNSGKRKTAPEAQHTAHKKIRAQAANMRTQQNSARQLTLHLFDPGKNNETPKYGRN